MCSTLQETALCGDHHQMPYAEVQRIHTTLYARDTPACQQPASCRQLHAFIAWPQVVAWRAGVIAPLHNTVEHTTAIAR